MQDSNPKLCLFLLIFIPLNLPIGKEATAPEVTAASNFAPGYGSPSAYILPSLISHSVAPQVLCSQPQSVFLVAPGPVRSAPYITVYVKPEQES